MTPEDLGAMTLADLEAMAARCETAARTIRDAMALLGGRQRQMGEPLLVMVPPEGLPPPGPPKYTDGLAWSAPRHQAPFTPPPPGYHLEPAFGAVHSPRVTHQPFTTPPPGVLPDFTPKEALPPHIAEAKRKRAAFLQEQHDSPDRLEKLKQFTHDGGENGVPEPNPET